MARTPFFDVLTRTFRIARFCDDHDLSTADGLARIAELESRATARTWRRRDVLTTAGAATIGAVLPWQRVWTAADPDIGIVGAGLAGLSCAYRLAGRGVPATVYDALETSVGGRCASLNGFFPGQTAERGGELIDNLHKTMLSYAQAFDLAREDYNKRPGETSYYFGAQLFRESDLVDEFRDFVAAMRRDLRALSKEPTADAHTPADVALDQMNLQEYLESRGAGPLLRAWVAVGYGAEYGRNIDEQSALNFVLFIHTDKRSKFAPWGVQSDERWHILGGNQQIPDEIARRLGPASFEHGMRLMRLGRTSAGLYELEFRRGSSTITHMHRTLVIALPFSVLRELDLEASLGLPAWKLQAIHDLGYGTNGKTMVGFNGPFWIGLGSNGSGYSDQADHQTHWETNWTQASAQHAVLTDYSHGPRGASVGANVQQEVGRWLTALENLYPGASSRATRVGSQYLAHAENWTTNPLSLGSYTCYLPGQFTTIAGREGTRIGSLHFAGEHTDSFYSWQGFMEGAALSGIRAANEILADIKAGD